jgi:flavin-dependent dehydrogenase
VLNITKYSVLGAGPAGSAISRRLARLGHSVIVVEKAVFPRPHVGESLVESILPLLDELGLQTRVEEAGFLRPDTAMVHWAGNHDYDRPMYGERGFQVDRDRFDKLLLDAAAECGVELLQPAQVLGIGQRDDFWLVDVSLPGRTVRVESNFLVDATGRVNLLGGKRLRTSAPMLALWAYWKNADITGAATRVESGACEWFWGAPLPDGTFNATVFLEPRRYREGVEQSGTLRTFYESLLVGSELLRCCLSGTRASTVSVCDATCYMAEEIVTPNTIKIGEAAFTIDPLSSQGVQTAIGTALHAAAVLHTISQRPENTRMALLFYNSRQRDAANLHAASAASFYARGAEFYGTGLWSRRATGSQGGVFKPAQTRRPATLPEADSLIKISCDTRIMSVPCLKEDFIVEACGLTHSNLDHSLVFVENGALVLLLKELTHPLRLRDLMERWIRVIGPDSARRTFFHFWNIGILCDASGDQRAGTSVLSLK